MLSTNAVNAGVKISFDARVTEIDPWAASVTLSTGECLSADLIVGADGCRSLVRESVVNEQSNGIPSGFTCFW